MKEKRATKCLSRMWDLLLLAKNQTKAGQERFADIELGLRETVACNYWRGLEEWEKFCNGWETWKWRKRAKIESWEGQRMVLGRSVWSWRSRLNGKMLEKLKRSDLLPDKEGKILQNLLKAEELRCVWDKIWPGLFNALLLCILIVFIHLLTRVQLGVGRDKSFFCSPELSAAFFKQR